MGKKHEALKLWSIKLQKVPDDSWTVAFISVVANSLILSPWKAKFFWCFPEYKMRILVTNGLIKALILLADFRFVIFNVKMSKKVDIAITLFNTLQTLSACITLYCCQLLQFDKQSNREKRWYTWKCCCKFNFSDPLYN